MQPLFFAENLRFLRKSRGWNQADMQDHIGYPRTTWNNYENSKSTPNLDDLMKIANFFGISESDLLHKNLGERAQNLVKEDLNSIVSENTIPVSAPKNIPLPRHYQTVEPPKSTIQYNLGLPRIITVNEREEENIIYVPVKARAGYLVGYGDAEYIQSLPSYRMPGLSNGTYRMFEVEGPSMAPNIISGDRVVGQWVSDLDEIRENRVHILVTKEGVVIKRVLNRIDQRGKLVLKSDTINHRKEYPTYEINPDDVLEIWYARVKLSSDFSEPIEVYHRLADLEADVTAIKSALHQIKTIG